MDYTTSLSPEDLENQKILLQPKEITKLQEVLGDCQWLTTCTRIDVKYPVNHFARCVSPAPTLYDYLKTINIMHYMIGTKSKARRIGGKHGAALTATVDASFAPSSGLKGQSSYTIHMGGGGTVMADTIPRGKLLPLSPRPILSYSVPALCSYLISSGLATSSAS
jgi:hypothetical protein